MMGRIRDEELMAHLDGELPGIEDSRVAGAIAEDAQLRAEAEAQRRLKARLARRFDAVAKEPVPERFRAMLETNVLRFPAAQRRRGVGFGWPQAAAIAASFAVGIVAAQMMPRAPSPAGVTGGTLVAAGALAQSLDRQLASDPGREPQTRIGVSFAARDGRLCRTFETDALAGLACREKSGWHVVTSAQSGREGTGEYRQAASGPALVMKAAEQMMVGEPFGAEAERQARDRGWTLRR